MSWVAGLAALVSRWAMPALMLAIPLHGYATGVGVYRSFVDGAEEGLKVSAGVLPYLVAIMFATALFRSSGALASVVAFARPLLEPLGIPGEVLPLLVLKPLSGAASLAYTMDLMVRTGPDSFASVLACVSQASFDTTLYVISLYFGSVGVKNVRHTLVAALLGDFAGFLAALSICRATFPYR